MRAGVSQGLTPAKEKGDIMKLGYVRVSTVEQNEERQLVTMEQYQVEKVFTEKISAKDTNRPKLKELLEFAREGDTIYIHDFSRLARNTQDLLTIVETLNNKNIHLVSNKENIDTSTPTGKLLLTVIAAINTFERENLKERQAEGIAIAKKKGVYKGRKPVKVEEFGMYYNKWKCREMNKADIMKILGITRPTLNKLFKEYEQNSEITT